MRTILEIVKAAGKRIGLSESWHLKIENGSWMPLVIEAIGQGPDGLPAVSVCHYGEQNGDAMRDPEMCFQLDGKGNLDPYYFRNDYVGIEQESRFVREGRVMIYPRMHRDQKAFSRTWDRNIREQGFIQAARRVAASE